MNNRGVLITGASTGIGLATAEHLLALGYRVFPCVRKTEDAERLTALSDGGFEPVILDVTDEASIAAAYDLVSDRLSDSGLYGLVNNAGVSLASPLEYIDKQHLDTQFHTNVYGPALMTKYFLPLIRQASGRIVNVSSGAGQLAVPLMGIYSATKFALEAMSDALRVELRHAGIGVSLVVPGAIETPIHGKNLADAESLLAALPAAARARYGGAIAKQIKATADRDAGGTAAATVAKAIARALADKRPKARYTAGSDAKALSVMRPLLSAGLRDRIVGGMTGL